MNNTVVKKIMSAFEFTFDEEETKNDKTFSFYTHAGFFENLTDGHTFYTVRVAFEHQNEDNEKDICGIVWIEVFHDGGISIGDCRNIEKIIKHYGNKLKDVFPLICDEEAYYS